MKTLNDYELYFRLIKLLEDERLYVIERFNFKDKWANLEQLEVPQIIITNYENDEKLYYFDSIGAWNILNIYEDKKLTNIYQQDAELIIKLYKEIEDCYEDLPIKEKR